MVETSIKHCFAFSAYSYNGIGPSMTFQEVIRAFPGEGINVTAYSPRLRARPDNLVRQVQGAPWYARYLPWRMIAGDAVRRAEDKVLQDIRRFKGHGFFYSFPDLSERTLSAVLETGMPVVREMIGVHRGLARQIMIAEHDREGLPRFDDITSDSVDEEVSWLNHADCIFAPNADVFRSLVDFGIPESRILETSYGWSPSRFPQASIQRDYTGGLRLLFVGRISYAKGAHHLLRAWQRAGTPGTLLLAGRVQPELQDRMKAELAHPSVRLLGFKQDLGPVYAEANAFAIPTLFEGGPQVTLEAAAHGLPLLVSPMGTARLVDGSSNGLVIDPLDENGWVAAIRELAASPAIRESLGKSAQRAAQGFTWEQVSRRRAQALKAFFGS